MAPIEVDSTNLISYIDKLIANNNVIIFSKSYCPYCNKVKELFTGLNVEFFSLELDLEEKGPEIQVLLEKKTGQKTVPNVFVNGSHLGGCDNTLKAHSDGTLSDLLSSEKYDYDLIVIGGGSGGLSASKEASLLGRKVAVCDFVKPSPKGTSWGLGGTCVNVGCIPKKLMHQAATLGHLIHDSKSFGWELPEAVNHTWEKMRENVQNHIYGLNWGYRVQLREKGVEYLNAFAEFTGPHTIKTTDKRNRVKTVTSRHFILAMGGRPKYPEIPGVEYCISSDDVFSLPNSPGKTLVVGASYVALECAGFLAGIGLDTTVAVRSILLRGFDQDMANRIGMYMEENGVKFIRGSVPTKIEEISAGEPGLYRVSLQGEDGEITTGEYNTVLVAIGRDPCTANIGLDTVGVKLNPRNGKVVAVNDQSNVPYIYAIGDILDGRPELTPVAIQAGKLLARRLYAGSNIQCDYIYVPTTVFTPIEYGTVGYSEEDALAKFGEENIEVYHKNFVPLEYTVPKRNEKDCYSKIICLKSESEKVVGFHYLGPNAGEITQGFALGIKMGATKYDFDNLIGIHPTVAETFTMMTVTKRSGASVKAGGC